MTYDGDRYFTPEAHAKAATQSSAADSRSVLVYMAPGDFLKLANHHFGSPRKITRAARDYAQHGGYSEIPYLKLRNRGDRSAQVTGHEGRHRSLALRARGVQSMPVRLVGESSMHGALRWGTRGQANDPVHGPWPTHMVGQDGRYTLPIPHSAFKESAEIHRQAHEHDGINMGWITRGVKYGALNGHSSDWNRRYTQKRNNKDYKEVDLPIRSLTSTQDKVNHDLGAKTKSPTGYEHPAVVKFEGEHYIADGHHRVAKAAQAGKQHIRVRLYDMDEQHHDQRQHELFSQLSSVLAAAKHEWVRNSTESMRALGEGKSRAAHHLVENIKHFGKMNDEDARAVAGHYLKHRFARLDPITGQSRVKHGGFLGHEVLNRMLQSARTHEPGTRVHALWKDDGKYYPAVYSHRKGNGKHVVHWEGDEWKDYGPSTVDFVHPIKHETGGLETAWALVLQDPDFAHFQELSTPVLQCLSEALASSMGPNDPMRIVIEGILRARDPSAPVVLIDMLGNRSHVDYQTGVPTPVAGPEVSSTETHPVPEAVKSAARRGIALRAKHGKGGIGPGQARARQLVSGKPMQHATVMRMHSFFSRHAVDKQGKSWNDPSSGKIAWLLWGGDAGQRWSAGIAARHAESKEAAGVEPDTLYYVQPDGSYSATKDHRSKGVLGKDLPKGAEIALLDSRLPYTYKHDKVKNRHIYSFTSPHSGEKYKATIYSGDKNTSLVDFEPSKGGPEGVTNREKTHSAKIFSTVGHAIRHHLDNNPGVKNISFEANKKEPQRVRLYEHFANRFATKHKKSTFGEHEQFTIAKKDLKPVSAKETVETADIFAPLYVHRPLLNVDDLQEWADENNLGSIDPESHVTVCYSKTPVDWMAMPYTGDSDGLTVPAGGPRAIDAFGKEGKVIVLRFVHPSLNLRAQELLDNGCTSDFPDYKSHVTLFTDPTQPIDPARLKPYSGPLVFGPEIFGPVKDDDSDSKPETSADQHKVHEHRKHKLGLMFSHARRLAGLQHHRNKGAVLEEPVSERVIDEIDANPGGRCGDGQSFHGDCCAPGAAGSSVSSGAGTGGAVGGGAAASDGAGAVTATTAAKGDPSPYEFDQTLRKGRGWRTLPEHQQAQALHHYINKYAKSADEWKPETPKHPKDAPPHVAMFHLGQVHARDGNHAEAIKHMSAAAKSSDPDFNNYAHASVAFLRRDQAKFATHYKPKGSAWSPGLKDLHKNWHKPYSEALGFVVTAADWRRDPHINPEAVPNGYDFHLTPSSNRGGPSDSSDSDREVTVERMKKLAKRLLSIQRRPVLTDPDRDPSVLKTYVGTGNPLAPVRIMPSDSGFGE